MIAVVVRVVVSDFSRRQTIVVPVAADNDSAVDVVTAFDLFFGNQNLVYYPHSHYLTLENIFVSTALAFPFVD